MFRFDPVPYTRCWRPGGRCYRDIRTTAEHRASQDPDCRFYRLIRAKRNRHCLPTAWDDIAPSRRGRGWKACTKRRRQWDR